MIREDIYELARESPKNDWRTYNKLKNMLDEKLISTDYTEFCTRLAEILEL